MKRNNINKNDILENIKHHHGLPISFSEKIFNFIFDIILEGLERDGRLKIAGFGTFKILNKNARTGRNPKTKVKYQIKSRKVVVFSPSIETKNKINGKN
tara:strand:- start:5071 stop:5367 length:297 start_codon:yes stop_codon:yes gene_type:complete